MAFVKPQINKINADIANLSIYLRSTKKFGKTTLFRDLILAKYGDPSYGLLVGCGAEIGYKMLDNLNYTQVSSWRDLVELKKWLIEGKNTEHNVKIIAFDTGDEMVLLADKETIRQSNIENPNKTTKSIKGAFSGFTAGEKYSANNLIKPYITDLQLNGFGTWVIAHSKFKTIKDKGSLDEDGYQQLTSNLGADYEAAFGDCMDVCLTGVIDRDFDEKVDGDKKKRYATDVVRKLYFRGTPMIDAGGRFADGAVPEYMVFDKPNMGADFLKVIEDGMEKSKTVFTTSAFASKKLNANEESLEDHVTVTKEEAEELHDMGAVLLDDEDEDLDSPPWDDDVDDEEKPFDVESAKANLRSLYKSGTVEQKKAVKEIRGDKTLAQINDQTTIEKMLAVFE